VKNNKLREMQMTEHTILNTVSTVIENAGVAADEAAKLILSAALGGADAYLALKSDVRTTLLDYIVSQLNARNGDVPLKLESFTNFANGSNAVPRAVEDIEFIKLVRDHIINGNYGPASSAALDARKNALAIRGELARELASKVDDNHEALLRYLLREPNFSFDALKQKHSVNYSTELTTATDSLWEGKVDTAALMNFGLSSDQIKTILDTTSRELESVSDLRQSRAAAPSVRDALPVPQAAAADVGKSEEPATIKVNRHGYGHVEKAGGSGLPETEVNGGAIDFKQSRFQIHKNEKEASF
jgi:hypothetical protein